MKCRAPKGGYEAMKKAKKQEQQSLRQSDGCQDLPLKKKQEAPSRHAYAPERLGGWRPSETQRPIHHVEWIKQIDTTVILYPPGRGIGWRKVVEPRDVVFVSVSVPPPRQSHVCRNIESAQCADNYDEVPLLL
jgi:hypothetical protein